MKTTLRDGEVIVRKGAANLQRGIETVGGKLYLTNQRIIFETHIINIQRGTTEIDVVSIKSVEKCWTKFLNLIPLVPNSLAITTNQGTEYRFVLFGRTAWVSAINEQKKL